MTTDNSGIYTYLQSLDPPESVDNVTYSAVNAEVLGILRNSLPEWDQNPEDPFFKGMDSVSYILFLALQRANNRFLNNLIAYANGVDLDHLAARDGVIRLDGESDEDFRRRIPLAIEGQSIGNEEWYRAQARASTPGVQDVEVTSARSATGFTITTYALKAGAAALTATERTAMQVFMNDKRRKLLGIDIVAAATTQVDYTITGVITYDSRETPESVMLDAVRESVYAYIDDQAVLNGRIYLSAIRDALFVSSAGVKNVTTTAPAADLAPAVGQVYVCPKTTTGVTLTTVDLAP